MPRRMRGDIGRGMRFGEETEIGASSEEAGEGVQEQKSIPYQGG
ncbi:hypothetical protein [Porphyromonas gingivicanis]|nr:hypothetical protein [Porphyromonas gingivicanis]